MFKPFSRLHCYLMAHAPIMVLTSVTVCFLARLSMANPPMACVALLLIMALVAPALMTQAYPLNKHLAVMALLFCVGIGLFFPDTACASIGTMMRSLKNDMNDWFDALVYACYGGGIFSTAIGVSNGIKKSKGDQQVTTGSIFGYGLGGPALGMVGYIMDNAAESLGGSVGQMNKLPGGL